MVPILNDTFKRQLQDVESLILSEVNVKELEYLEETAGVLVKKVKPDFKKLGPRFGKDMKLVAAAVNQMGQEQIQKLESQGSLELELQNGSQIQLELADVEISSEDIPGWLVASEGAFTVALDIKLSDSLKEEGIARELVNRIQNFRKDAGFEVTDKIDLQIESRTAIDKAIQNNKDYICSETLAANLDLVQEVKEKNLKVEIDEEMETYVSLDLSKK
jgi:isoleucyl-tRNA synthetase